MLMQMNEIVRKGGGYFVRRGLWCLRFLVESREHDRRRGSISSSSSRRCRKNRECSSTKNDSVPDGLSRGLVARRRAVEEAAAAVRPVELVLDRRDRRVEARLAKLLPNFLELAIVLQRAFLVGVPRHVEESPPAGVLVVVFVLREEVVVVLGGGFLQQLGGRGAVEVIPTRVSPVELVPQRCDAAVLAGLAELLPQYVELPTIRCLQAESHGLPKKKKEIRGQK